MRGPTISRRGLLLTAPALVGLSKVALAQAQRASDVFRHGVASGDPSQDGFVIWTRVHGQSEEVTVSWEVALDSRFRRVLKRGETITGPFRDHTVKVELSGLPAGKTLFYRFQSLDSTSMIGRARTLASGRLQQARLAVCSCSNYPAGYFNVYRAIAQRTDLDAVIHLGDYIYEYESTGYATQRAEELGRVPVPEHEIVTLTDYRLRYAQYRSDPDLQAMHANHAMIAIWDDHEITNDAWMHGAQNHSDDTEGDWATRRLAALQAYYEWLPIREGSANDRTAAFRRFEFGDLASLLILETRVHGRDRQISAARGEVPLIQRNFDVTDPDNPRLLAPDESGSADTTEVVPIPFDATAEEPVAVLDYQQIKAMGHPLPEGYSFLPDAERFRNEVVGRPDRTLLGRRQRNWVDENLQDAADKSRWTIIGSQVLMSPLTAPDLHRGLNPEQRQKIPSWYRAYVPFTSQPIPFNMDAWDGYGWERDWLLDRLASLNVRSVGVAGDTHTSWASELSTTKSQATICAEFGAPSVTSPDIGESLGLGKSDFSAMVQARNPHVKYCHTHWRGYLVVALSRSGAVGHFHYTPSILDIAAQVKLAHSWQWSGKRGSQLKPV